MSDDEFLKLLIDIITGKMRSPPIDDIHDDSISDDEVDSTPDYDATPFEERLIHY